MSDEYKACADPANDPNDWFIEKNGLQYDDEGFPGVTPEAAEAIVAAGDSRTVAEVFSELEANARKDALRRRRHAKDKCYTECAMRTWCLSLSLDTRPSHGVYGGYYPEERRVLLRKMDARRGVS